MQHGDRSENVKKGRARKIVIEFVQCPNCSNDNPYRISRKGFLHKWFLPLLGLYPWQCRRCRRIFMARKRHVRRHDTLRDVEQGVRLSEKSS